MLKYEFSKRDKVLLTILSVLLLVLFYYNFAYVNFKEQMREYDAAVIEDELQIEEAKAMAKSKMMAELDKLGDEPVSRIPVYNAQAEEISCISEVLDPKVSDLSINWQEPFVEEKTVKRSVNLSFRCNSYNTLINVVRDMQNIRCRCLVRDISVSVGEEYLSVSMKVTFYETLNGCEDFSGLNMPEEEGFPEE